MNTFQIISLADSSQSWAQVLRTGRFVHPAYGEFEVTPESLQNMAANFANGVRPVPPTRLVVDYNHGDQNGRAAGWITALEVRNGTELWAQVEWTDEAANAIRRREYQFTSAEFAWAYQDKGDGTDRGPTLLAMAITNRPFVEGMAPLALSEQVSQALADSRQNTATPPVAEPVQVVAAKPARRKGVEDKIRTLLKLEEDADVLAAVKLLRDSQAVTLEERDGLNVRLTELTAERDALQLRLSEANRDALLARYEQEGKLTPAMREAWAAEMALAEPERFARLMETLPVVVNLTEIGSERGADSGDVQLTEAELSLGRQLGLSEADLLKAKGRR